MPERQNSMQRPLYETSAGQRSFHYRGVTIWNDWTLSTKSETFTGETLKNDLPEAKHARSLEPM
jgi:hypothetical protein